jgi:hypothetical protein
MGKQRTTVEGFDLASDEKFHNRIIFIVRVDQGRNFGRLLQVLESSSLQLRHRKRYASILK